MIPQQAAVEWCFGNCSSCEHRWTEPFSFVGIIFYFLFPSIDFIARAVEGDTMTEDSLCWASNSSD